MASNFDDSLSNPPQPPTLSSAASKILQGEVDPAIALAIREGVADALRTAGWQRPLPALPKGGVMTDEFIAKFEFAFKEKGDPSPGCPYTRKRDNEGDYQTIWPRGYLGYPVAKAQGRTRKIAEDRLRKKLKKLKRYEGDEPPTKDEEKWLDAIYRLVKGAAFSINPVKVFQNGLTIEVTQIAEGLTNDVAADGLEVGRKKKTTLEMAKTWFFEEAIPDPRMPSERKTRNEQRQNLEPVIRELVAFLGEKTPVLVVINDPRKFNRWYRKNVIQENDRWAYSTRGTRAATVERFFREVCEHYDLPKIKTPIFKHAIQGQPNAIIAPLPEVIEKTLLTILAECPELLLYALLQVWFALRPEEAYRGLDNPGECFDADVFFFSKLKAKRQTKVDRYLFILPAAQAWFSLILDLFTRIDHHIYENGERVSCTDLQERLNKILRRSGFNPPKTMPKEAIRKSRLSAAFACGASWIDLMQEAAHTDRESLEAYIVHWKKALGLALFSIFPPGKSAKDFPEKPLYRIYEKHTIQ